MARTKLNFKSFRQLEGNINALVEKTARGASRDALRKATRPVLKQAKALVPVGRTGNLKRSLIVKIKTYPRDGLILSMVGPDRSVRSEGSWPVKYAHLVEFGHVDRNGKFHPGRPFMRPAIDSKEREAKEIYAREISASIKRIAARVNKQARL